MRDHGNTTLLRFMTFASQSLDLLLPAFPGILEGCGKWISVIEPMFLNELTRIHIFQAFNIIFRPGKRYFTPNSWLSQLVLLIACFLLFMYVINFPHPLVLAFHPDQRSRRLIKEADAIFKKIIFPACEKHITHCLNWSTDPKRHHTRHYSL